MRILSQAYKLGQIADDTAVLKRWVTEDKKRIESELETWVARAKELEQSLSEPGLEPARVMVKQGDLEGAQRFLEKYINILSTPYQRRAMVARARQALGNISHLRYEFDKAGQHLRSAIRAYRQLFNEGYYAVDVLRAETLGQISATYRELARLEEAVEASQVSVKLYRRLSAKDDVFLLRLAISLVGLSGSYRDLGRRDESISANEEATSIFRRCAKDQAQESVFALALSLVQLSRGYKDVGRHRDALKAAQEGVGLLRKLNKMVGAQIAPMFAEALVNLGSRYMEVGRPMEGSGVMAEASLLYSELDHKHPGTFTPALADTLYRAALLEHLAGAHKDALRMNGGAVLVYRKLAAARPEKFRDELAAALLSAATFRLDSDGVEDAALEVEEAVGIFRELASKNPGAFLPSLARALITKALVLEESVPVDKRKALSVAREAVSILEPLATQWPDVFAGQLLSAESVMKRLSPVPIPLTRSRTRVLPAD